MKRYKISWRIGPENTIKARNLTPAEFEQMLNLLLEDTPAADELWVFISEPTNFGYEPLESIAKKCERFKKYAEIAHKRQIPIAINPWPTFGAEDPRLKDNYERELPFQPMVSCDGTVSKRIACPISPEFLEWSQERYRLFARTGANQIWVEDDCRITHLGINYPCFCSNCISGFENGIFADRESLVKALNMPENGDLRRKWSAWGAKRLATWCAAVRLAVDDIDPNIETPFMSVGYSHTTFSGNYIEECMKALRAKGARPGHGFYFDKEPMGMFDKVIDMSRQIVHMTDDGRSDVQYEEESLPYSPLGKSVHTRLMEMALSIWGGCNGIAMNHMYHAGGSRPFDYLKKELAELKANRSFFDRYLTFAEKLPQSGVWAAFTPWMMARMQVNEKGWFHENDEAYGNLKFVHEWPGFGLPATCDPKCAFGTLIQGKTAEVLTDEELEEIFKKPVFLDGSALQCLWERGWGKKAGVRVVNSRPGGLEVLSNHPLNGEFAESSRGSLDELTYDLEVVCDDVEILAFTQRQLEENQQIAVTKYGNVVVLGFSPYKHTGTPGHMTLMRNLYKEFGATVLLESSDAYQLPRVNAWARANANRAAVLLINSQTSSANSFDVCFKGNAETAAAIGLGSEEIRLEVRKEEGYVRAHIENLQPWEMKVILFE